MNTEESKQELIQFDEVCVNCGRKIYLITLPSGILHWTHREGIEVYKQIVYMWCTAEDSDIRRASPRC